jgi:hypothetical protein
MRRCGRRARRGDAGRVRRLRPEPPTAEDLADIDLSPDHTITVDEDGYEPPSSRWRPAT